MNKYEKIRRDFLPKEIKVLFVAEAPPENEERFFYFGNVSSGDSLFVNLMRVLYPELKDVTTKGIRRNKPGLLRRFQADGYYLIDALPGPISLKTSNSKRVAMISDHKEEIAENITAIIGNDIFNPEFPKKSVVLIKNTVFDALDDYLLLEKRLPVINRNIKIPFPAQGHVQEFMSALRECLAIVDAR